MNLGFGELAVVMLIVLLLFGGKKLPDTARQLGRGISELRRSYLEVKRDITSPSSFTSDVPQKDQTASNVPPNSQPRNSTPNAPSNS